MTTSQTPVRSLRDGEPWLALVNAIDHGMTIQEMVEAPRIWTQGDILEVEDGFCEPSRSALAALGHSPRIVPHVGGGMNAIRFEADGTMAGAACWRADGTAIGLGGGLARAHARLWPDRAPVDTA